MNIIVCLDNRNGMLFRGRRQSQDSVLRQQALALAGKDKLWMNGYSARQFADHSDRIAVDEDFLHNAPEEAWCFVENTDILPFLERIRFVVVYRWNRHYPSDVRFPMEAFSARWQPVSSREFPGRSHETVTEEVYRL